MLLQVYIIEVIDRDHKWTVKHRYSDFHDLHEKVSDKRANDFSNVRSHSSDALYLSLYSGQVVQ